MVETQKEREDRMRRKSDAYDSTRTGDDPSFVAVNTLPTKETTSTERTGDKPMTERITPGMTAEDRARMRAETGHSSSQDKPLTEKIGDTLRGAKEDIKETVTPERTETDRTRMENRPMTERTGAIPPTKTTTTTTKDVDWDKIQHPGMEPCDEPYGTRPVSELKPPSTVNDKADLAAARMLDREKTDREKMDREAIMSTATPEAAAMRARMASKETTTTKETTRIEPMAGERTIRQGAAIGTEPTRPVVTERPVTGVVVPPRTTTTTTTTPVTPTTTPPLVKTPVTMTERDRMHAEDPSVHPDWETQPQINAPRDVGIPTAEGQADAARIRSGERRSDVAKEPRLDRRGGDIETPLASGARRTDTGTTTTERRMGTETRDDRSMTQKMRDAARDTKEKTKETARDVKEDVDRKI